MPERFPDPTASIAPLLVVRDLDASTAFWSGLLGGEVVQRMDGYALVRIGGGFAHLARTAEAPPDRDVRLVPPDEDPFTATAEVVIRVADCRAVHAELERRGVPFPALPVEPPWGGEVRVFLRDPDHHLVEITSPA
jgi:catechol 2,3-dioxygenase-like lactoylglutathione lyase family enzyme